jgi:hypothetical protein
MPSYPSDPGHAGAEQQQCDVFREHLIACYVTDQTSLKLRHRIGMRIDD